MRRTLLPILLCLVLTAGTAYAAASVQTLAPGDTLRVECATTLTGTVHANHADLACAPPPHVTWHRPTDHEHGEQPPDWVLASTMKPFTQSREGHAGYKGILARDGGGKGIESYLIAHIVTSEQARSHGDHDYQLWVRNPDGQVFTWSGVLDFSSVRGEITAPIPERTSDTGERPIALAERSASDGCETWYSRPGAAVFDLGWTVCGRYQKFDATVLGGVGTVRGADWVLIANRLPASHPLRANCTVEFGVCRHSFLAGTRNYGGPSVRPVN